MSLRRIVFFDSFCVSFLALLLLHCRWMVTLNDSTQRAGAKASLTRFLSMGLKGLRVQVPISRSPPEVMPAECWPPCAGDLWVKVSGSLILLVPFYSDPA